MSANTVSSLQQRRNPAKTFVEIRSQFMLPQTYDVPATPSQLSEIAHVALSVSPYFCTPERLQFRFPFRQTIAVPEIPIDEYGDAVPGQNQVWTPWQRFQVFAETETPPMKFRPYETL